MRRRSLNRGFTMIELLIATSLLAVIILALMSANAQSQQAITESSDQVIAANSARNTMENMLQFDWQNQLLPYYQNYLNGQTSTLTFSVPIPGEPSNNSLGTFTVREPDNTRFPGEYPAYNQGAPHIPFGPYFGTIPMPGTPGAPTALVLIARVVVPAKPGRGPVVVELRTLRSYL